MKKKIKCQTCGDNIEDDGDTKWRSYSIKTKKDLFFCKAECCALWYAEEIDYDEVYND